LTFIFFVIPVAKELDLKNDLSSADIQKAIKALVKIAKNGA